MSQFSELGSLAQVRQEKIVIKMGLSKDAHAKHKLAVETLIPDWDKQMLEGDTLRVTYTLTATYFGDIVKKLTAVQQLCEDPDVVLTSQCEELEAGRILIFEVLKKLEAVIKATEK